MARAVQAHLRAYHRGSVERRVAGHNERVAFDLATAATAGAVEGDVDAVYFSPASSTGVPAGSVGVANDPLTFDNIEFATVSFLIPLTIPLDPSTLASFSTSPTSPTPATGHLPLAVLVDHVLDPHAPAALADVRVSHWLPEPWVARLADTPVNLPAYAYQSTPLVDYLGVVADVVCKAVKVAATSGVVRREVVGALAKVFAECLIEADTQTYSTLALLIEPPTSPNSSSSSSSSSSPPATDLHPVLATLVFPDRFPVDPPVLILRAPTLSAAPAASTPVSSGGGGSSPSSPVSVARSVPEYTTRPKLWSVLRGGGGGGGGGAGASAELAGRLRGWVVEEAGAWMARVGAK